MGYRGTKAGIIASNLEVRNSISTATNKIVESNKETQKIMMGELLLKKEELETKDRVDISLREYESLKGKIKKLESAIESKEAEINRLGDILKKIGLTQDEIDRIIPDTLIAFEDEDILNNTMSHLIKFNVKKD